MRHQFSLFRLLLPLFILLLAPNALRPQEAPTGEGGLSMLVIGDAGDPGKVLLENAAAMLELARRREELGRPISQLYFLGDNFYPIGLNRPPLVREALIELVLGPVRPLMEKLGPANVVAIPGNHDYYCNMLGPAPYGRCRSGSMAEQAIPLWTYHWIMPASKRLALREGSRDSVEVIFFDSAILLTQSEELWHPPLDSLGRLLRRSADAPGVRWRILLAHHSPFSVGEHGGWRIWSADEQRVLYLGNCIEEAQDPYRYIQEFVSAQDNCTPKYQRYVDSLARVIDRSGARIHLMMAGHDHSLQLLNYPDTLCDECPDVYVISGAGSKRTEVRSPFPPFAYTHPVNTEEGRGRSIGGFTLVEFPSEDELQLLFYNAETGEPAEMGGGRSRFVINDEGRLQR